MTNLGAALEAFIREHEYCGELRLVCQGVADLKSTRREAEPFSNHPNTFSPSSSDSLHGLSATVTGLPDALTMTKLDQVVSWQAALVNPTSDELTRPRPLGRKPECHSGLTA